VWLYKKEDEVLLHLQFIDKLRQQLAQLFNGHCILKAIILQAGLT
jgi:hypothetical protein